MSPSQKHFIIPSTDPFFPLRQIQLLISRRGRGINRDRDLGRINGEIHSLGGEIRPVGEDLRPDVREIQESFDCDILFKVCFFIINFKIFIDFNFLYLLSFKMSDFNKKIKLKN